MRRVLFLMALAITASSAALARNPVVIRLTDGNNAGPPGRNTGPGAEQPTLVQSVVNGSEYVTVVWMSSQVPEDDAPYQCKCATVMMDPAQGPTVVVPPTQITHNNGNRPCNHPHMDINPSTNQILLSYGTNDPNQSNVQPYVQGLDTMCNVTTDRLRIGRNNGNDGAPWVQVVDQAAGLFQVGYLENNQRSRAVGVTFAPDNTLTKLYNRVVVDPANIGRPSVARVSDTRTLFCSSNGDNRPPEIGVRCAMLDATTGDQLWSQVIAASDPNGNPRTFMNQPIVVKGENGRYYVEVEQSRGPHNGDTRGATTTFVYTLEPDDTGPHIVNNISNIGANQVHATLCAGHFGPDAAPHLAIFDASITGSGFASARFAKFDPLGGNLLPVDTDKVLGGFNGDSGYLANIYGQNPNDQGRDFMRCMGDLANPGFQAEGGFLSTVQSFFVFPFAGHVSGEDKNSLFLSFLPAVEPPGPPVVDHSLNVFVAGDGVGKVFSSPLGVDGCDNEHGCTGTFEEGVSVVLTAVAADGSTFSGWTGDCTGTAGCVLSMDGDKNVTATFVGPVDPGHPVGMIVTVAGDGTGTVTSDPAGISCSNGTCTNNFDRNAVVTLTAKPDAGSVFSGFGGACTGTDPCQVTMSAAQTVTATFDVDPNAPPPPAGGDKGKGGGGVSAAAGCGCSASGDSGGFTGMLALGLGYLLIQARKRRALRRALSGAATLAVVAAVVAGSACAPADVLPSIDVFTADQPQAPAGTPVQLQYFVRNATGVTISQVGGADLLSFSDQLNGTVYTPPLAAPTTFILIAHGPSEVGRAPIAVTKTLSVAIGAGTGGTDPGTPPDPAATHAAVATFAASQSSITTGSSATVSWQTTGAASGVLLANDAVLDTIAASDLASGELSVTPTERTVYTISLIGADGQQVTSTAVIDVQAAGVGPLTAASEFDADVKPILAQECSACHEAGNTAGAPAFLGSGPDQYYTSVTADPRFLTTPENSLLLLKGAHAGPAFLPAEAQQIQAWLLKEIAERGAGTTAPTTTGFQPRDLSQALTRFGACMDRSVWDATYGQSNQTQAAKQGTEQGQCNACHTTGTGGAFLSQSSGDTFDMNRTSPYILKLVLSTTNSDGTFKDLVPARRWELKGGEGDAGHPSFVMTQDRIDAINSFVDQTLTRFHDYTDPCTQQ